MGVRPYFVFSNRNKALDEYRVLENWLPGSPELGEGRLLQTAGLLSEGGENARSLSAYAVCLELHPVSTRARARMAALQANMGQTVQAIGSYTEAIKKLSEDKSLVPQECKRLAIGKPAD